MTSDESHAVNYHHRPSHYYIFVLCYSIIRFIFVENSFEVVPWGHYYKSIVVVFLSSLQRLFSIIVSNCCICSNLLDLQESFLFTSTLIIPLVSFAYSHLLLQSSQRQILKHFFLFDFWLLARLLNMFNQIHMIRDPQQQLEMVGVPEEHLSGHAFHVYNLTSPDKT